MAILLTPFGYTFDRAAKLLPCGAPLQTCLSFAVCAPAEFETQKVKTGLSPAVGTERYYPCLFRREFQSELPQTLFPLTLAAVRSFFPSEPAHEVVCVSNQDCGAPTTALEHSLEPQIKAIRQEHIR